ncbi:MAG: ABC transporter substrate-binding protein [Deltaproteobacteria bacterium]|nr:ABC transporter substrate-binding protein [Deltaproteobacteria bacterium]
MEQGFKKVVWVAVLILFFAAIFGLAPRSASARTKQLVVCNFGGYSQKVLSKVFFEPFKKETGINVIGTSPPRLPKLKAMVESGNVEWDVVVLLDSWVERASRANLLEPIDYSKIDREDLYPDAVSKYGVGIFFFATGMAYNKGAYPHGNHPKTWKDFWDVKKFPGKRGMYKGAMEVLEFALMADGVPIDKLYPLDVDRAFKSLDRIKPHISLWWRRGQEPIQALVQREVDLSTAWLTRVIGAQRGGAPIAPVYNQAILRVDMWGVPRGCKNKQAAMDFVAFSTDPMRQALLTNLLPYGPVSKKAFDYISPQVAENLFSAPKNASRMVLLNPEGRIWWGENEARVLERFQQWLLK